MGCRISKDESVDTNLQNNEMARENDEKIDYKSRFERKMCLAKETPEPDFDLSACNLKEIPSGVFVLCRVLRKEILNLRENKISSFSGGFLSDLSLLNVLDISFNKLKQLPADIHRLENLRELLVSNNSLVKLPQSINKLKYLELLDLSCNKIQSVDEINCLPSLRILNLSKNAHLKRLPNTLTTCDNLSDLIIDIETISSPPQEVTNGGTENIIKFLTTGESMVVHTIEVAKDATQYNHYGSEDRLLHQLNERELDKKNTKFNRSLNALDMDAEYGNENALIEEFQQKQQKQKELLLQTLLLQQNETEILVTKIQQQKDNERHKLIEDILRAEENANIVIENLLSMKSIHDPVLLEKEQIEEERLLEKLHLEHSDLRKQEIISTMIEILAGEEHKIQDYQQQRNASSRDILEREQENEMHLKNFFREYEKNRGEIIDKICEDEELQKHAVAALISKNDARSWSLVEQLKIVEAQLATMTQIEIERKIFCTSEQINELGDKRMRLTYVLLDLLEQQELRKQQLLDTLLSMEAQKSNEQDFWLLQYQKLLDSRPLEFSIKTNSIDPLLGFNFLVNGVIHCLPFLQKIWQNDDINLEKLSLEDLESAGIRNERDRKIILKSIIDFLKDNECAQARIIGSPTAPLQSPTGSNSFEENAHSLPPKIDQLRESTSIEGASECVVCMEETVKIIFLPCGHMCCCLNCEQKINVCPMCRANIERKIRVVQP